jgi:hypothetical protein
VDGRQHEGWLLGVLGLLVEGGELDGVEREGRQETTPRRVVGREARQVLQVRLALGVVCSFTDVSSERTWRSVENSCLSRAA